MSSGTYPGYTFKDYTCEDTDVVFTDNTDPNTTFIMLAKDVTIQANWTAIPFTVTMADPSCNSVTGGPEFHYGDVVSISCTSSEFVEWSCDDPTVVFADKTNPSTTFTMGLKDITINHSFRSYDVTVDGSTAATTGAGSYLKDAVVTVDAGTKAGYRFAGWTSDPAVTFADASSTNTTFTMLGSAVTVTANWEEIKYAVTIDNAQVTPDGSGSYAPNASVTINAKADGFHHWEVVSGGVTLANVNAASTTFTMPNGPVRVKAVYNTEVFHTATINGVTAQHYVGEKVPIDAGTKEGYIFDKWTSDPAVEFVD